LFSPRGCGPLLRPSSSPPYLQDLPLPGHRPQHRRPRRKRLLQDALGVADGALGRRVRVGRGRPGRRARSPLQQVRPVRLLRRPPPLPVGVAVQVQAQGDGLLGDLLHFAVFLEGGRERLSVQPPGASSILDPRPSLHLSCTQGRDAPRADPRAPSHSRPAQRPLRPSPPLLSHHSSPLPRVPPGTGLPDRVHPPRPVQLAGHPAQVGQAGLQVAGQVSGRRALAGLCGECVCVCLCEGAAGRRRCAALPPPISSSMALSHSPPFPAVPAPPASLGSGYGPSCAARPCPS